MAVLMCRCCGAALEVKQGLSVCRCQYCGVQQTVPILDFDEKALLWERADGMRRAGEYDRAMSVYEQIAELCPDEPDVFWAMVLCRYGVEYVEEPLSHKRVPTINRIQYSSVIDDKDYRKAVSLASNGDQRRIYISEAKKLDELRQEILAVSLNEKPYDIFICYKETDISGRRTEDSVLAAKLYRALTAEGWRVFFSRVTLESKAGTEYEPYIFAALNTAKLMLVVGTSTDNLNAVWVRNEWSRYLARMTESGNGMLVPLYKGMMREHLPKEFSHLQSFDMTAPDFEEELLRGVRKLLTASPVTGSKPEITYLPADHSGMLRRAALFLEDGDFARADGICETVLDSEPENPRAYLIKLLAEYRVPSEDRLCECRADITVSGNYAKVMRFGDESLRKWLSEEAANCRYEMYCAELEAACTEEQLLAAAAHFDSIADHADSADKAAYARKKASDISAEKAAKQRELAYLRAVTLLGNSGSKADYIEAAALLKEIGEYNDSTELLKRCKEKIAEADEKYAQKAAAERAENLRRRRIRRTAIASAAGTFCLAAAIIAAVNITNNINTQRFYDKANELRRSGDYSGAIAVYAEFGDTGNQKLTKYEEALSLYESGNFDEAEQIFIMLSDYSDSPEKLNMVRYSRAGSIYKNGNYDEAADAFEALGEYKDSKEYTLRAKYNAAVQAEDNQDYLSAAQKYASMGDFFDCPERSRECFYKQACRLIDNGDYTAAEELFTGLDGYRDSETKVQEARRLREEQLSTTVQSDDDNPRSDDPESNSDTAEQAAPTANAEQTELRQGDVITLGGWNQGKNGEYLPLEWIVLKTEGGKALLTTKYLVDFMPYGALNWKDSAVRSRLNGTFYDEAFTEDDKKAISDTELTDTKGNTTRDKVFILSREEAFGCLSKENLRTDYSEWGEKKLEEAVKPTLEPGYSYARWAGDPYWLRDIGDELRVCILDSLGGFASDIIYTEEYIGVRPAVWIGSGEL